MTPEQERLLNEVNERLKKVEQYTTSIGGSLEFQEIVKRYASSGGSLSVSDKGADSEDQAVNEGGAATYNVLTEPVGFLEITIDGVTYHLPYFNA